MSGPHRAQHRLSEGDYYAQTEQQLQQNNRNLGPEDKGEAQRGARELTEKAASDYSVAQSQLLLQGQTPRGDAPAPAQNYASSTHEQLYGMVHDDLDLDGINERSRVTNDFGNWLADASNAFADAATTAGASWQGPAASQADMFFQNTANHAEHTGNAVQLISNHYSQQSAAAHYAQTNMPEPTGFDQQAELAKAGRQYAAGDLGGMVDTMTGIQAKQQQADAAHAQAVQVLQGLDNTYHATATTQPIYQPPPEPGQGSDSTSAAGFHGTSGSSFTGAPNTAGGGFTPTTGSGATLPPGSTPPPSSSYIAPGTTSGGTTNFGGSPGFRPGPSAVGGFPRMTPDGLAVAGPNVPGSGGGDTPRSRPGIGRGSGFAGSRVSGGGYTGGTKETAPGEGKSPGEGKGSGKGATGRLERGATAAAAAKAKAGGAGAGAAGAAGKKKEEDQEHKSKIPLEDELFEMHPERGPDGEKIIPPVIGG